MESVRPARDYDYARCAELLAAARGQAGASRGGDLLAALGTTVGSGSVSGDTVEEPTAALAAWAGDSEHHLLVGVFDGATVGVALGSVHSAERRVGRIECCYVQPEAQGVGVGTALIAELVKWFAEAGCSDVDAVALPGDRSTKQLLEAAGFKARLLVLHRPLG